MTLEDWLWIFFLHIVIIQGVQQHLTWTGYLRGGALLIEHVNTATSVSSLRVF
jgi:hypothetical protein